MATEEASRFGCGSGSGFGASAGSARRGIRRGRSGFGISRRSDGLRLFRPCQRRDARIATANSERDQKRAAGSGFSVLGEGHTRLPQCDNTTRPCEIASAFSAMLGALLALQVPFPVASLAADGGDLRRAGGRGPLGSLARDHSAESPSRIRMDSRIPSSSRTGVRLPYPCKASSTEAISPSLPSSAASLELMTPALPIPTRPRLFLSGEILPTFAIRPRRRGGRGPRLHQRPGEPVRPCASDDTTVAPDQLRRGRRQRPGHQDDRAGRHARLRREPAGWPFRPGSGSASSGSSPPSGGSTTRSTPRDSWSMRSAIRRTAVRTSSISGLSATASCARPPSRRSDSRTFNGIGPGLDIEMDAGRYGPLGVSLFLGAARLPRPGRSDDHLQHLRDPSTTRLGMDDVAIADFEVEVEPWMYRAHVGIRFQWLGSPE